MSESDSDRVIAAMVPRTVVPRSSLLPTTVRRMPNQPKTPLHSFRCPDELWSAAKAAATANDEVLAEELRRFLERYVKSRAKRS